MTWWEYVTRVAQGDTHDVIARSAGVTAPSVSRWRTFTPKPENVAAFARAYNRPVLEAFIAAGFLTADEAAQRPTAPPSLATLDDDELLEEIRRRMRGGQHEDVAHPAQKMSPEGDGGEAAASIAPQGRDHYGLSARTNRTIKDAALRRQAETEALGEGNQDDDGN